MDPHLSWRNSRGDRLRWDGGIVWNIFGGPGPSPDQIPLNLAILSLFDTTQILPTEMVIEFGHGGTR